MTTSRLSVPILCFLIPLASGLGQEAPKAVQTDRQKFAALKEAKRLSQKAAAYEKQGKSDEAEHAAEQALALEEQVRGPWHIEVARRLDEVADLYAAHKKEAAADLLYERAKAIRERALSTHPDVYEKDGRDLRLQRKQPAEKAEPGASPASKTEKP